MLPIDQSPGETTGKQSNTLVDRLWRAHSDALVAFAAVANKVSLGGVDAVDYAGDAIADDVLGLRRAVVKTVLVPNLPTVTADGATCTRLR